MYTSQSAGQPRNFSPSDNTELLMHNWRVCFAEAIYMDMYMSIKNTFSFISSNSLLQDLG